MDRFEQDAMEDLMSDAAEGPARADEFDEDSYDEFDEGDAGDETEDEFLGSLLGGAGRLLGGAARGRAGRRGGAPAGGGGPGGGLGGILGGLLGADEYDEYDETDSGDEWDAGDEYDTADEYEDYGDEGDAADDLVADAMEAEDSDEFLRRLGGLARRIGRGVGSVARTVAPIASMIPLPQAQLIGRLAGVAGRLMADGADEFETIDEMVESMDEDEVDAAVPLIAGLALRRAMPAIARVAPAARRQIVRSVAQTARAAVRRGGPRAARVAPRVATAVRRVVQRRPVPARRVPQVVRRVGAAVVRRPQVVRRIAARPLVPPSRRAIPRPVATAAVRRAIAPVTRRVAGGPLAAPRAGVCRCGRMRQLRLRGPVSITIHSR